MRAPITIRSTGIEVLGEMPWGSHLCIFYETQDDLLATLVPYFQAGLERNEFCVLAVSDPLNVEDAKAAFAEAIPDFDEHYAAGSIEILPAHEWYLPGGEFDLKRVTRGWYEKLNNALDRGYEGMRASGNAFWIAFERWKEFTEYEQELDKVLANQPMLLLCSYGLNDSQAVDILDVVRAHTFTVARRKGSWEIIEAPRPVDGQPVDVDQERARAALSKMTTREIEVLRHIVMGAKSKQIAHALGISKNTVDVYRSRILLKTMARNLPELVRLAVLADLDRWQP